MQPAHLLPTDGGYNPTTSGTCPRKAGRGTVTPTDPLVLRHHLSEGGDGEWKEQKGLRWRLLWSWGLDRATTVTLPKPHGLVIKSLKQPPGDLDSSSFCFDSLSKQPGLHSPVHGTHNLRLSPSSRNQNWNSLRVKDPSSSLVLN